MYLVCITFLLLSSRSVAPCSTGNYLPCPPCSNRMPSLVVPVASYFRRDKLSRGVRFALAMSTAMITRSRSTPALPLSRFPPCRTSARSGTGKSTTIFHIIDSRVRQNARVLLTSTRNQAVEAVTEKVHTLGVLVSLPRPLLNVSNRTMHAPVVSKTLHQDSFWRNTSKHAMPMNKRTCVYRLRSSGLACRWVQQCPQVSSQFISLAHMRYYMTCHLSIISASRLLLLRVLGQPTPFMTAYLPAHQGVWERGSPR